MNYLDLVLIKRLVQRLQSLYIPATTSELFFCFTHVWSSTNYSTI